jgi:hypothetical protein
MAPTPLRLRANGGSSVAPVFLRGDAKSIMSRNSGDLMTGEWLRRH